MQTELYIGPAGWSYPDWNGTVYPHSRPARFDYLTYLASYFNLIEINNTFYRVPANSSAYFRLHGRNHAEWFKPGTDRDKRYDYLYTRDELVEWVERIKRLAESVNRIHVVLNNHFRGQAVANALVINAMISGQKTRAPRGIIQTYPHLSDFLNVDSPENGDGFKGPGGQRSLFENENGE